MDGVSGQALADAVSSIKLNAPEKRRMDINDLFPSKYLKAADLKRKARQVVITEVAPEVMSDGQPKPLVGFSGLDKGLVCNKTNSMLLASNFGSETNGWIGQTIELYPVKVPVQGEIKDGIRVRVPMPPANTEAAPATPPAEDFNDNIPNWD